MELSDDVSARLAFTDGRDPDWQPQTRQTKMIELRAVPMDLEFEKQPEIDPSTRMHLVRLPINKLIECSTYDLIHAAKPPEDSQYEKEVGYVYWPALIFQSCTEYYDYDQDNTSAKSFVSITKATIREVLSDPSIYAGILPGVPERPPNSTLPAPWRLAELLGIPGRAFCLVHDEEYISMDVSLLTWVREMHSDPKIFGITPGSSNQEDARTLYIDFHNGLDIMYALAESLFPFLPEEEPDACERRGIETLQKFDESNGAVSRVSDSSEEEEQTRLLRKTHMSPVPPSPKTPPSNILESPPVRCVNVQTKPPPGAKPGSPGTSSLESSHHSEHPKTPPRPANTSNLPVVPERSGGKVDKDGFLEVPDLEVPIDPNCSWDKAWATMMESGWTRSSRIEDGMIVYKQPVDDFDDVIRDFSLSQVKAIARQKFGWNGLAGDEDSDGEAAVAQKPKLGTNPAKRRGRPPKEYASPKASHQPKRLDFSDVSSAQPSKATETTLPKKKGRRGRPPNSGKKPAPIKLATRAKSKHIVRPQKQPTKRLSSTRGASSDNISLDDPSHPHYSFYYPIGSLEQFLVKELGWKHVPRTREFNLATRTWFLVRPGKDIHNGVYGTDFFGEDEDLIRWCQKERLHERHPFSDGSVSSESTYGPSKEPSIVEIRKQKALASKRPASEPEKKRVKKKKLNGSALSTPVLGSIADEALTVDPEKNDAPWCFDISSKNFKPPFILTKIGYKYTFTKYIFIEDPTNFPAFETSEEARSHFCKFGVPKDLSMLTSEEKLWFETWVSQANLPPHTHRPTMLTVPLIRASEAVRLLFKLGFKRGLSKGSYVAPPGTILERDGPSKFETLSELRFWLRGEGDLNGVLMSAKLATANARAHRRNLKIQEKKFPLSDRQLLALRMWSTVSSQDLPVKGVKFSFSPPSAGSVETSFASSSDSTNAPSKTASSTSSTLGGSSEATQRTGMDASHAPSEPLSFGTLRRDTEAKPDSSRLPAGGRAIEGSDVHSSTSSLSTGYDPVCNRLSVWATLQKLGFSYSGVYRLPSNFKLRTDVSPLPPVRTFTSVDEVLMYCCRYGIPNLDRYRDKLVEKEEKYLTKSVRFAHMPINCWGASVMRLSNDQAWRALQKLGFGQTYDCRFVIPNPGKVALESLVAGQHIFESIYELRAFLRGSEDITAISVEDGRSRRRSKMVSAHVLKSTTVTSLRLWAAESDADLPTYADEIYIDTLPPVSKEKSHVLQVDAPEPLSPEKPKPGADDKLASSGQTGDQIIGEQALSVSAMPARSDERENEAPIMRDVKEPRSSATLKEDPPSPAPEAGEVRPLAAPPVGNTDMPALQAESATDANIEVLANSGVPSRMEEDVSSPTLLTPPPNLSVDETPKESAVETAMEEITDESYGNAAAQGDSPSGVPASSSADVEKLNGGGAGDVHCPAPPQSIPDIGSAGVRNGPTVLEHEQETQTVPMDSETTGFVLGQTAPGNVDTSEVGSPILNENLTEPANETVILDQPVKETTTEPSMTNKDTLYEVSHPALNESATPSLPRVGGVSQKPAQVTPHGLALTSEYEANVEPEGAREEGFMDTEIDEEKVVSPFMTQQPVESKFAGDIHSAQEIDKSPPNSTQDDGLADIEENTSIDGNGSAASMPMKQKDSFDVMIAMDDASVQNDDGKSDTEAPPLFLTQMPLTQGDDFVADCSLGSIH